jgi:hypothetical protein
MFVRLRSAGLILSPGLLHLTRSIAILRPWCVGALLIWSLWALLSAWGLVSHVNNLIKSRLMPQCHAAGSAGSGMSRNLRTSRRPNLAQRSSLHIARAQHVLGPPLASMILWDARLVAGIATPTKYFVPRRQCNNIH